MVEQWCVDLLQTSNTYLSDVILSENSELGIDEDLVISHLFTLGEIAQLIPEKMPRRLFMLVQSLIAAPTINSEDIGPNPSQEILSQRMLTQFKGCKMGPRVRAHAFITLGKLCLQNEDIAKKCVAALARELETSTDATIRNNVIFILSDLCVRYTTVVDCYISNIAACLKDESRLVRKQTLTLLTSLLQEDYVKWKGALFFRYVMSIVDSDQSIQSHGMFIFVFSTCVIKDHCEALFYKILCLLWLVIYESVTLNTNLAPCVLHSISYSCVHCVCICNNFSFLTAVKKCLVNCQLPRVLIAIKEAGYSVNVGGYCLAAIGVYPVKISYGAAM